MCLVFLCHTTIYPPHDTNQLKKIEAKEHVVQDYVYYQAGISKDSQAHAQDRQRLIHWGERRFAIV